MSRWNQPALDAKRVGGATAACEKDGTWLRQPAAAPARGQAYSVYGNSPRWRPGATAGAGHSGVHCRRHRPCRHQRRRRQVAASAQLPSKPLRPCGAPPAMMQRRTKPVRKAMSRRGCCLWSGRPSRDVCVPHCSGATCQQLLMTSAIADGRGQARGRPAAGWRCRATVSGR